MNMVRTPDFLRRSDVAELMDGDCDYETFRDCLIDLSRVNRMTLAYRPTLAFLELLHDAGRLPKNRPLHILDVGCGYGDMLREVAAWAHRKKVEVKLTGIDLSPWSALAAREATSTETEIAWLTGDVFAYRPDVPADVILSALLTHHLPDDMLVRFLRWQEDAAQIGWFVNDLHRHPVPYHVFAKASRLLRLHRFVQHDGPVSISRSFRKADWQQFLQSAQITGADVAWWMPFRLCVSHVQPR